MTDQDYPKLPDLPPIGDVLNSIRSPNPPTAPQESRKLSPQELIEQLKEHFHGDTSELIEALGGSMEFERETTCPRLKGEIKLVRRGGGRTAVICPKYLPHDSSCCVDGYYGRPECQYIHAKII